MSSCPIMDSDGAAEQSCSFADQIVRHLTLLSQPLQQIQTRVRAEQEPRTGYTASRSELAARPPCQKPSTPTASVTAATRGWRRHTSDTSLPLLGTNIDLVMAAISVTMGHAHAVAGRASLSRTSASSCAVKSAKLAGSVAVAPPAPHVRSTSTLYLPRTCIAMSKIGVHPVLVSTRRSSVFSATAMFVHRTCTR